MRDYTKVMTAQQKDDWGIADLSSHETESASASVAHLTRSAIYATTPDGYPSDADLADVFAAATAAQAAYTAEAGNPHGIQSGGVSLGPLSIQDARGQAMSDRSLQGRMASLVAPKTVEILSAHGLLNGAVGNSAWGHR